VIPDTPANPDLLVILDNWVPSVQKEQPELPDQPVGLVIWVQLEQLDSLETPVTRDLKVPRVHRVQPAPVISVAIQDPRAQSDRPVARDSQDRPDPEEVRDLQVLLDQLVPRDK